MFIEGSKDITALEEKNLIAIVTYLYLNGNCKKMDIYENVSTNPRIPEKLDRLESMGILTQKRDVAAKCYMISLTDVGKNVGKHLVEADNMLKGN